MIAARRHSLAFRLALSAVLVALTLSLALGVMRSVRDLRVESERMDATVHRMLAMVHEQAVEACYELDSHLAQRVAHGLSTYELVLEVTITDDFGTQLAHVQRQETHAPEFLKTMVSNWHMEYSSPLNHGTRRVGTLVLRLDSGLVVRDFVSSILWELAGNAARDLLLAAILTLVFHLTLTRPLLRLSNQVAAIDPARPAEHKLDVGDAGEGNELSLLAVSLNRLLMGFEHSLAAKRAARIETKEREVFIHGLMDSVPDAVLTINRKGMVETANPAAERMFAHLDKLKGTAAASLVLEPEGSELGRIISGFHATNDPEVLYLAPLEARTPDGAGGERGLELSYSAMNTPSGSLVVCLAHDVTARKRMEAELKEARACAEAASRGKSEFLANMSHEIRTPLNGTLGMLQLLSRGELDQDQRQLVDIAMASGRSLLSVIDDVLDFSRIEAGRIDLAEKPFSLGELGQAVVRTMAGLALDKDVRLALDLDPNLPGMVRGDKDRMRQVFVNLMGNAIKFSDQGEITLSIWLVGVEEEMGLARILVRVADMGIGIPDDKMGAVFESFTQVDGSARRRHQGAGLGLGIVKRLVERMGGHLAVESEVGKGTSMYVALALPLAQDPEVPAEPHAGLEGEHALPSLRLLVAEDNMVNRLFIVRLLERMGHHVIAVRDGMEALARLAKDRFDMVFMDVQMPEMDGMEVLARMRRGEAGDAARTTPVIAVTAHAMEGDRERFLEQGMDSYIAKPMDAAELMRVLSHVYQDAHPDAGGE